MTMTLCIWQAADLLPHVAPMLLLDRVVAWSDDEVIAEADITTAHVLAREQGVPAHVGIELMAQTCGAHVGVKARATGRPVRIGLLLGTRRYRAECDWFSFGDTLRVHGKVVFIDETMGVYDCRIERANVVVAEAQLSLYQPEDAASMLAKMRGEHV